MTPEEMKHFQDAGYRTEEQLKTIALLLEEFPADVIMLAHAEVMSQGYARASAPGYRNIRAVERKLFNWEREGLYTFDDIYAKLKAERAGNMMSADKKRFANSIKTAISDMDRNAKGFGYRDTSEYLEVRNYLTTQVKKLLKGAEEYD